MSVDHSHLHHRASRPLLAHAIVLATLLAFGCFVAALDHTLWAGSPPAPTRLSPPGSL